MTDSALGNAHIIRLGARRFRDLLLNIRRREDVSDVAFEVGTDFDSNWPGWDYLFIATLRDKDEVASWFNLIPPDLILPTGLGGPWVKARVIRIEDIAIAAGHRLWALQWEQTE